MFFFLTRDHIYNRNYPIIKLVSSNFKEINRHTMKPTNWQHVRPTKTQISLDIHPVWSESCCPHEESLGS